VILFGDLAESAIKRATGIKDSSWLVPGHGGVADRLDSLLFAVPAVYWYLQWVIL
jgi:phosphatidate cytidylyltransferase